MFRDYSFNKSMIFLLLQLINGIYSVNISTFLKTILISYCSLNVWAAI